MLREISHVTCVRVCAPVAMRARNVMERVGISDSAVARKEVRRNDAAYARRMQHLFHVDYRDPMLYDMTFNTEQVSVDACVGMIAATVAGPEKQPTPESTAKLEQMVTLAHVRSALRSSEITSRPTPSLTIDLDSRVRGDRPQRRGRQRGVQVRGGAARARGTGCRVGAQQSDRVRSAIGP